MVPEARQGGRQPLSLSVSPIGTPPQAMQGPEVIPGRARVHPQGRQPRGAAVFNEPLGPEARPGNVQVSRSCQPRPAEGPSTPPYTTATRGSVPVSASTLDLGGRVEESYDFEAQYPANRCNTPPKSWALGGFPLLSTLQAFHTLLPPP